MNTGGLGVQAIAGEVRSGRVSAVEIAGQALKQVAARNGEINAFTAVLEERALATAASVDAMRAAGRDPGPLAGVPFAVKNLFDISGLPTIAGSIIDRALPPATQDATLIGRLSAAGAVLIGALNMDEYAFGFSTQNTHYGPTRNPHDLSRIAGGSSGGSAAAVAASLVPFTLGSDTNGSIRVPAALCGVFGLKPTYGRLSRAGTRLFAESFDHVGPLARSVGDIAAIYDVLQGPDPGDPVCTNRPSEAVSPVIHQGIGRLRIAVADGYFTQQGDPSAFAAVERVAKALGVTRRISLPEPALARAAAMVITAVEGAGTHLADLKSRAADFDPNTRPLFLSGALVPGAWYAHAQRFRRWYCEELTKVFREVDVILAPATPYPAFPNGQRFVEIASAKMLAAAHLGVFTQPLSFAGLPVLAAPVAAASPLPLGVQIAAAPWREDLVMRAAAAAEIAGELAAAPLPTGQGVAHA
jgi:AtzE family amidohydrolase